MSIAENIALVQERMAEACKRAGRDPSEVKLIAVSKTKPFSMIEEARAAGVTDFGENYPQELREKALSVREEEGILFHQIGHLQRNKVRSIIDHVVLIHSVDSLRLARQIDAEAAKCGKVMDVLLEVNIAAETSKFGVLAQEAAELALQISELSHVRIRGLMTIAPYVEDPEENRVHFRNLRALAVDIKSKNIDNVSMDELSMGMTGDYEVAIEEGATMIRVGTGIFGARDYTV